MRFQSLHSLWHKNFFELFKLLDYITLRYNLILSTFLQFYFLILTAQECPIEKTCGFFIKKADVFLFWISEKVWILLQSNFQLIWNAISFTVSTKKTHLTVLLQHWSINYDRSIISIFDYLKSVQFISSCSRAKIMIYNEQLRGFLIVRQARIWIKNLLQITIFAQNLSLR